MLLRSTKDWDVLQDEASGKEYYLNKATGVSTWEPPPELEPSERPRSATDLRPPPVGRASAGNVSPRGPPPRATLQKGDFEKAQNSAGARPLDVPASPMSARKSVESRAAAAMRPPAPPSSSSDSERKGTSTTPTHSSNPLSSTQTSHNRTNTPMSPLQSQARLTPLVSGKLNTAAGSAEDSPASQAALWLQTLTPQDQEDQPAFLNECFEGLDAVIGAISTRSGTGVALGGKGGSASGRGPVDSHPLANTILQSVLMTRELLNCWSSGMIHDVALDSLTHRVQAIQHMLQHHRSHWPKMEGPKLSKMNQRQQWQERKPYVHVNSLALKEDQILDLNLVDECHELQTGTSSEFKVTIRNPSSLEKISSAAPAEKSKAEKKDALGREYHFRTDTDAQKQWWLGIFRLWGQHNKINHTINCMSTSAQARVYNTLVFRKRQDQNGGDDALSGLREFLFATTAENDSTTTVTKDFRQARLQALGSSIKERFKVLWPQKMAKDKKREIEIDLSRPHRFLVYKPSKSGVIEEIPSASFTRFDLIGYKLEGNTLEILFDPRKNHVGALSNSSSTTLPSASASLSSSGNASGDNSVTGGNVSSGSSNSSSSSSSASNSTNSGNSSSCHDSSVSKKKDVLEEFRRKFVLESAQSQTRLKDLLQMFVQPSVEETPTLLYQDVLSTLHRIDMRTAEDGKFSFGSQLHSVFEELNKLAPGNMHCMELEKKSNALPLNVAGDLERVKMLVRKIYAVDIDIDHKHLAVACMCHETQKRCLLMLYRCLLKAQALGDLTHYIRETSSPELKAWLLRAIWGILGCANKAVKCTGECGSNSAGGFDFPMQPLLYYVDQASNKHPLEPSFINVLFEILLNEMDFSDNQKPINALGKEVAEHDVIGVVLHALTRCTVAACDEGLKGFVLLAKSPANNAIFISQSGWQSWILPLVSLYYRSSWNAGQETEKNIFNMGLLLLTNLQFATLMTTQKEHEETRHALLVSLDKLRSAKGWNHNTVMLARTFLGAVVTQIKTNARDFTDNFDPACFDRLWGVLQAVVEFLFFLPLAQKNAQVDKLGADGQTTLMIEAHKGNLAAVKHLIEVFGADAELTNTQGHTALDLALAAKHNDVVEYLKTPRDASRHPTHDTIHLDEHGDCLDLELVQKVVASLKACNVHNLKSFDATGEKKTKSFIEFEKEATMWWEFFAVCERAFTEINAASRTLSKLLDSRQSSGLLKTGAHNDTILTTLSAKLFEVQKTLKHGHTKYECDLEKKRV